MLTTNSSVKVAILRITLGQTLPMMDLATATETDFRIRSMSRKEEMLAASWAAKENWNPGLRDIPCLRRADSRGLFVGELNGKAVGCISAVDFASYGIIGWHYVMPRFRRLGVGFRLWEHAMTQLVGKTMVSCCLPDQIPHLANEGFSPVQRIRRYVGEGMPSHADPTVDILDVEMPLILAYDGNAVGASRAGLLQAYVESPGHVGRAMMLGGRLGGFAIMRLCRSGFRIGPVLADDDHTAQALLASLFDIAHGQPVQIDVPESNTAALIMLGRMGVRHVGDYVWMEIGGVTDRMDENIFAIADPSLG